MLKLKQNEIVSIINFDELVSTSIQKLLNDDNRDNLSKAQIKALEKITPVQTIVLGGALKLAAKDGLNENEVSNIINDLYDLVNKASSKSAFDKLMKNPYNPKFKLTPEVSEVLKNLQAKDKDQLLQDLKAQAPELKEKIFTFFDEIQSVTFPIIKSVVSEIVSFALASLGKIINDNIDNPIGDILEDGLKNMSLSFKNVAIEDKYDLIGETLQHDSV